MCFIEVNITEYVKYECNKENVILNLVDNNHILVNNIMCKGYFSHEPTPEITVAVNSVDYEITLLHEFCHYLQFKNNSIMYDMMITSNSESLVDDWLAGIEIENIEAHIDILLAVEMECEHLAIDLATRNNLKLDTDTYCKKANSYLLFYKLLKKTRKWYNTPPYEIAEVWKSMPPKIEELELEKHPSIKLVYSSFG